MKKTGLLAFVLLSAFALSGRAADRTPGEFAIIFLKGYAGDNLPEKSEAFEQLLTACRDAHFNVVLGRYTDERAGLLKKHGMKMMVDLLVPDHHVYKNVDGAKALCESLRESEVVFAYHLWSDGIGGTVAGRSRDIRNVQSWDPNHAAYVGDRSARSIGSLEHPDLIGYYDFHWTRGGHFRHLFRALAAARKHKTPWMKYTDGAPGRIGLGNVNRVLYTLSTSIAFGLKGYMFHYEGGAYNDQTGTWGPLGEDWKKVNAEFARIGPALIDAGLPEAVYSTRISLTAKDRDTGKDKPFVPAEFKPIPDEAGFAVEQGEAIVGIFPGGRLFLANHNAYREQPMKLRFSSLTSADICDRKTGTWRALEVKDNTIVFPIPPAAGELIRYR
ncbi:MAG: hypothetical protein AAF492_01800 [Verrucomicrobiota bacterium]